MKSMLKDFWEIFFPPKPTWVGNCSSCGREVKSWDKDPDPEKCSEGVCIACYILAKVLHEQEQEERRQIELHKKAIKELEEERAAEARERNNRAIERHLARYETEDKP